MSVRSDLAALVKRQRELGTSLVPIDALERILERHSAQSPWAVPILCVASVLLLAAIAILVTLEVLP